MILVDSHCHLDMLKDYDSNENIINRSRDAGVKYLQTICTRLDNLENILAIANQFNNVYASVGVHPSEIDKDIASVDKLLELSKNSKIIGLGETGLDYYYNKEEEHHLLQKQSFANHIICAQSNKLPVIIHTRDAEQDTYEILMHHKKQQDFPGLIHCFTASKEFAKKMLDLGLYISVSGIITFKNAEELREIVKNVIPSDRLLIETDSPYLAPVPKRGKTNEPSYTRYVAEFIADLKSVSLERFAEQTTDNFFRLFNKANAKLNG